MSRRAASSAVDGDLLLGYRKEGLPPEWATRYHGRNPDPDLKLPDAPTIAPSSSIPANNIVHPRDLKARIPLQNEAKFTGDDWKMLRHAFPYASCIQYSYPFIVICGVKPSVEPIGVKNLIVEFYDHIDEFMYCPGAGRNPALADPLHRWPEMPDRRLDTFTSIKVARTSLSSALGITICALSTDLHLLVVEVDEKDYHLDTLPGIVGGRITLWAVYGTIWGDSMAHSHAKDPRSSSAPTPRKLVPEAHVEEYDRVFSYHGADGFTTGLCWLQLVGFRDIDDSLRVGHYSATNFYIMRQTRASASESNLAKEGICCGAPLLHQESDDVMSNACVGFFWKYGGTNALIPTLDCLLDQGWQTV